MVQINRTPLALDVQYRGIQDSSLDDSFRGDYAGGANLIYKAFARPGSIETDPVWQISKLYYDGNNNIIAIKWPALPNGVPSSDSVFIWSNRAAYTYT